MPDWNPAEIIGLNPKPLAYSLYENLLLINLGQLQEKNGL